MKRLICYLVFPLCVIAIIPNACADGCPTPDEVRERKISRDYEWTVDERTSLENILSVNRLIAVRIVSKGEFVSCRYSTGDQLFSMDGLPHSVECMITISSGVWVRTTTGVSVCQEKDTAQCLFDIECRTDQH